MSRVTRVNPAPGSENTSCAEDERSVRWHLGLRQADLQERRTRSVLQRLRPEHAGNHPVRWHRSGGLRGELELSHGSLKENGV